MWRRWVLWEGREENKKFDKTWVDSLLRLFTVDTVEKFWHAYQYLPLPG